MFTCLLAISRLGCSPESGGILGAEFVLVVILSV